jgi:hypothetical protein
MACAITGRVTESTTGAPLTTPSLALHRVGVVGETPTILGENGRFSFSSLCAGEYSLSAYSDEFVYWHKSLTLSEGQSVDDLQVVLTRGGRIVGQMLDEDGRPPEQGLLTLLRDGERDGRAGLLNVCGDLRAGRDGLFQSPPLSNGMYFLRFAGILQKSTDLEVSAPAHGMPDRVFDFLYPDAHHISGALGVAVEEGQTLPELRVRIPRPIRYRVKGRVVGVLPLERKYISVKFRRDLGDLDQVGWAGQATIQPDGQFDGLEQSGRYSAEVCEFAPPEPSGSTHRVRSSGNTTFTIGSEDIFGIEIQITQNAPGEQAS